MDSKVLPAGPLLIVRVRGGADLTKCIAAQSSATQRSTGGRTVCTNAHREMLLDLDGDQLENQRFTLIPQPRDPAVHQDHDDRKADSADDHGVPLRKAVPHEREGEILPGKRDERRD